METAASSASGQVCRGGGGKGQVHDPPPPTPGPSASVQGSPSRDKPPLRAAHQLPHPNFAIHLTIIRTLRSGYQPASGCAAIRRLLGGPYPPPCGGGGVCARFSSPSWVHPSLALRGTALFKAMWVRRILAEARSPSRLPWFENQGGGEPHHMAFRIPWSAPPPWGSSPFCPIPFACPCLLFVRYGYWFLSTGIYAPGRSQQGKRWFRAPTKLHCHFGWPKTPGEGSSAYQVGGFGYPLPGVAYPP